MFSDITEFHSWFAERAHANAYQVDRIPLEAMQGWTVDADTTDIVHGSGRFFAVRGLRVDTDHCAVRPWSQPIIVQPEIGILGIAVKIVNDRVYCLLQAKMEPGNVNMLQLSPTVQATRSNYTRVHKGNAVPYLEQFVSTRNGRTVFDALQSEQGSWFLAKRNRNMIVEVHDDLPLRADFCWLSLEQVAELMAVPNLMNMDARTVLSGMPFLFPEHVVSDAESVLSPRVGAGEPRHSTEELLSWLTEAKARYSLAQRQIALADVPGWERSGGQIVHEDGKYFSIIGVEVRATNREVVGWSQPMLAPRGRGVIAMLGRQVDGRFHVLMHAHTEAGTRDVVEMGPTVQCNPANYAGVGAADRPRYLDAVERAPRDTVLVDVVHSEEGGRFYHAENHYLVVDVGEQFGLDVPDDFCWMTVDQLVGFVLYGNHVNVEARCLLSCLVAELSSPVRPRQPARAGAPAVITVGTAATSGIRQ